MNNKRRVGEQVVTFFIFLAISACLYLTISYGMNRQETFECNMWASQAKTYPGFFLTQWQSEQCKAHGIIINALVK